MTTTKEIFYSKHNEESYLKTDGLFFIHLDYSYEDLLKELPQQSVLLLHSLIEQWKQQDERFFEILHDRKKWGAATKKFENFKLKQAQFDAYLKEVCAFFEECDVRQLLFEMARYFSVAAYETDGEDSWLLFDDCNEGVVPFTQERVSENGVVFHFANGEKTTIPVQALLFIRLLDVNLMKELQRFKLKANLDERLPTHAQLLFATCEDSDKANVFLSAYKKPLTSILNSVVAYNKLIRFLHDIDVTENSEMKQFLAISKVQLNDQLYRMISTNYMYYANDKREREEKIAASTKKKLEDALEKLEKQKDQNKELKKQQNDLKKQQKQLDEPKKVEVQVDQQEIAKWKNEYEKLLQLYAQLEDEKERNEDKLQKDLQAVKQENGTLQKKVHSLNKVTSQPQITTVAQWLEVGKELVRDINDIEEQQIRAFFELFLKVCDEQKALKPKVELASNLFGYVSVSLEGHYVVVNGKKELITAIPENIYLAEGQFVQVTNQFEYVQDYADFFDFQLNGPACFSVVKMNENVPYVYSQGELKQVMHEPHVQLRDGQIVSFTSQLQLIRYYKAQRLQLDVFEQSIRLKKHEPYYVQKVLQDGAVVTNVFTDMEIFVSFENAEQLQEGQFITVNGSRIVRIFYGTFYKLSSYYKKAEIAVVSDVDDACFAKKLNREVVIVKRIPSNVVVQVGDQIRIDEWHNYLELIREEMSEGETVEQRLARRAASSKDNVSSIVLPTMTSTVLIVGNPAVFESYDQLTKYGYEVEAVDGYESFSRIKQAAKNKDCIVVCTEFISHENMYAIKNAYPTQQVVYAERCGATQIALQLKSVNL